MLNISNSLLLSGSRNALYQVKKQTLATQQQRPSVLYETDWRVELNDLRSNLRRKEAEIIRLKSRIDQLDAELRVAKSLQTASSSVGFNKEKETSSSNIKVPFLLENEKLKKEIAELTQKVLQINGERNEIESRNRELQCELEHSQKRTRELEILERMRAERFEEEVKNLKPVVVTVEQDKQLQEGSLALADSLRSGMADIIFGIFVNSANTSQQRKLSSLIVFKNNINELRKTSRNGFYLATRIYNTLKQLILMYHPKYSLVDKQEFRDTFNSWLENSLEEVQTLNNVKKKNNKDPEQLPLYRLLALYYRIKFPLKGQNAQVDRDLEINLEDRICLSLHKLLVLQPS